MKVSNLFIYPLKSGLPVPLTSSAVSENGLYNDRQFAVIDAQNRVLTARECPKLLDIEAKLEDDRISFSVGQAESITVSSIANQNNSMKVKTFGEPTKVCQVDAVADAWFSEVLGTPCQLVKLNKVNYSGSAAEQTREQIGFADVSTVHLISKSSLEDLNQRLEKPVGLNRFRPNIVVENTEPYEEDRWKTMEINDCLFDVYQPCSRCVVTTIDPKSGFKSTDKEPLRTLSKYRMSTEGDIHFGIYLIPRKAGSISVSNKIVV